MIIQKRLFDDRICIIKKELIKDNEEDYYCYKLANEDDFDTGLVSTGMAKSDEEAIKMFADDYGLDISQIKLEIEK